MYRTNRHDFESSSPAVGMNLIAVAAVSDNWVIGKDGEIPWTSRPADKKQYRNRVATDPVILGRVTYQSMRNDLPGRTQVVLTSDPNSVALAETTIAVDSVQKAMADLARRNATIAYVLGGGAIYDAFLPYTNRAYLSRIPGEYDGDTFFPRLEAPDWKIVESVEHQGFTLETWDRV